MPPIKAKAEPPLMELLKRIDVSKAGLYHMFRLNYFNLARNSANIPEVEMNTQKYQGNQGSQKNESRSSGSGFTESLQNMDVEGLKESVGEGVNKITQAASKAQTQVEDFVKKSPITSM